MYTHVPLKYYSRNVYIFQSNSLLLLFSVKLIVCFSQKSINPLFQNLRTRITIHIICLINKMATVVNEHLTMFLNALDLVAARSNKLKEIDFFVVK